jgi:hypothetical protein
MKLTIVHSILIALLTAAGLCATPITGVTLADPPMMTPRQIVTIDLGNGLIWEGPAMTPEEWNQRMLGLPPTQGFGIGVDPLTSAQGATPTPEPSTWLMLTAGLAAGICWRRRR